METKHTKGPWVLLDHLNHKIVMGTIDVHQICDLDGCLNQDSNAALIAAAPDMLEALEALLKALPPRLDTKELVEAFQMGHKALDKAKGEI